MVASAIAAAAVSQAFLLLLLFFLLVAKAVSRASVRKKRESERKAGYIFKSVAAPL